jgi:hypothetical protein
VDPTGTQGNPSSVPYYANARLYGKQHLNKEYWNQMRLHGHLELAHGIKVDTRKLTAYHGSYKRELFYIHNKQHAEHPEILEGLGI